MFFNDPSARPQTGILLKILWEDIQEALQKALQKALRELLGDSQEALQMLSGGSQETSLSPLEATGGSDQF